MDGLDNGAIICDLIVPDQCNRWRLDQALGILLPEYSRSRMQRWIKSGYIRINDEAVAPRTKVVVNQVLKISVPMEKDLSSMPENLFLDVVYEDKDLIVINKSVGMVTHPGAGNPNNTLLNALLYRYPETFQLPRAGLIHRLDKNTSGLIIIARNLVSYGKLTTMLQRRIIRREYQALVHGQIMVGGTINANIGRHRQIRTLMAVNSHGKTATTHYRVIDRFSLHTYLRIFLETGRTHQIRVHLAHAGYPIIGDSDYGGIRKVSAQLAAPLRKKIEDFNHQALHATRLELPHPATGILVSWQVLPPPDFIDLLNSFKEYDCKIK